MPGGLCREHDSRGLLPALDGARLLCAPVNWPAFPRPDGERPAEIVRVQAGAAVNRMFIAACDRTGEEHCAAHSGAAHSGAAHPAAAHPAAGVLTGLGRA